MSKPTEETTQLEHFDIALQLAGFNFKKQHVELIMELYNMVDKKGGDGNLRDVARLMADNEKKYEVKK